MSYFPQLRGTRTKILVASGLSTDWFLVQLEESSQGSERVRVRGFHQVELYMLGIVQILGKKK